MKEKATEGRRLLIGCHDRLVWWKYNYANEEEEGIFLYYKNTFIRCKVEHVITAVAQDCLSLCVVFCKP